MSWEDLARWTVHCDAPLPHALPEVGSGVVAEQRPQFARQPAGRCYPSWRVGASSCSIAELLRAIRGAWVEERDASAAKSPSDFQANPVYAAAGEDADAPGPKEMEAIPWKQEELPIQPLQLVAGLP